MSSKRHQPYADVGLGQLEQLRNLAPFAHVVGDDHQDPGERRHRNVTGQRRRKQQHAQQGERMNDSRHRRLCSGANVGRGARDGSRRGQASKHRRNNVGHTLPDQLDVGIVMVIAHAVGNHRRHERLNRAQHRHRERRARAVRAPGSHASGGITKCGRPLGIPPKRVPIVSTGSLNRYSSHRRRPAWRQSAPECGSKARGRQSITATVQPASSVARGDHVGAAAASAFIRSQNSPGTLSRCSPKKSLIWVLAISTAIPLVKPITTGRGINFTADAHARRAQHDQQNPRHHRAHEQAVDPVHGNDSRDDHHEGARSVRQSAFSIRPAPRSGTR